MSSEAFLNNFRFAELTDDILAKCEPFVCGYQDLDDFFQVDAMKYSRQMIGRTYIFQHKERPNTIACAFSISNDSLRVTELSNRRQERFRKERHLDEKRLKRYPGILIGRLAVNEEFAHQGIGSALMVFIKTWLGQGNKAGCRFLIVDARNDKGVLEYYKRNRFEFLFSSEEEESVCTRKDKTVVPQSTRLMFYDLMDVGKD